jgi:uncharacterized protein
MIDWFKTGPFVSRAAQWSILLVVSAILVALLEWVHLPAALMVGAMIAGILLETVGGKVRVAPPLYSFSQVVIGCMIARVITSAILKTMAAHWPLFLGVMLSIIAFSCALGWVLSWFRILPDTTAIWGLLPGAAFAMMVMADAFGADGRLVAFIQYFRVVLVAIAASIVARFCTHITGHAPAIVWFPAIHWNSFLETLALIAFCYLIAWKTKIPAGFILVPLVLGAILNATGTMTIELPQWFLAASYALLGWNTGLRFTREILAHAFRALPQIILAVVLLMGACAGLAFVLVKTVGVDPLTAYLATNPGGVDAAAIIAASTKVDMPFVMSMQTARFMIVLLIGPTLSRWVARTIVARNQAVEHLDA